jgi:uncharacterized membrane protein (DUF106 family)
MINTGRNVSRGGSDGWVMSEIDAKRLVAVLEEIRDNQRVHLERQAEALTLQREQFALVRKQTERAERIQDRAEAIQAKSAQLIAGSRKAFIVILPVIVVLIIYLSWLLFRH